MSLSLYEYLDQIKEGVIGEPNDEILQRNIEITQKAIEGLEKLDFINIYSGLEEEDLYALATQKSKIICDLYKMKECFLQIDHYNTKTALMVERQFKMINSYSSTKSLKR